MYASRRCLGEYNSLDDYYLQGFFTNKQLRKQLRKAGLMNRDGAPVPEAIYRTNVIKADRRRKAKEELTKCLVAESINLQRQYENEIKSRLDEIAKLERVRKLRLETRPLTQRSQTQTKVKKKDLKYYLTQMDKKDLKRPHTVFECQLSEHAEKIQYNGDESVDPSEHIKTLITMQFLGDDKDPSQKSDQREIYVEQMIYRQKPLWVYLGQHRPLEFFKFMTYRHPTFPFCLNMYISGMLHLRVHTCCEYKFPIGTRLGGPNGKFVLLDVQGATTCGKHQCESYKELIPALSETLLDKLGIREELITVKAPLCPCQTKCVHTAEDANISFGCPCQVCMHLGVKNLMECRCACIQQDNSSPECRHIEVCDAGNEQCRCMHLDEAEGSSQPEQSVTPEHQCIHCHNQEQPQCQCQCNCQAQSPEEYISTEKSSSPGVRQCPCMQKASKEGVQEVCKHKCCSKKQDDFYNIEISEVGSSSASEQVRCCKVVKKKSNKTKKNVEICSECSCSIETEVKEESEYEKGSGSEPISDQLITGKIEYGDYMLQIKKIEDSIRSGTYSSDKNVCSDKASLGSSSRRCYSTCFETNNETDIEENKNTTTNEMAVCANCCRLTMNPEFNSNKVVHIVEKPIQMNITIEGYCKNDRDFNQQANSSSTPSETMHITVCCDDSTAQLEQDNEDRIDANTQTSKVTVSAVDKESQYEEETASEKTISEAPPKIEVPQSDTASVGIPEETDGPKIVEIDVETEEVKKEEDSQQGAEEAAEPAEAAELPLSVEHSRTDMSTKPIEIPIEFVPPYESPEGTEYPPTIEFIPPYESPEPIENPPTIEFIPPYESPEGIEYPPSETIESPLPSESLPPVESPPLVKSPPATEPVPPVKSEPPVEPSPPVESPPPVKSPPPVISSPPVESPPPVGPSPPVESPPPVKSPPQIESPVKSPPPVISSPPVESPPPVESSTTPTELPEAQDLPEPTDQTSQPVDKEVPVPVQAEKPEEPLVTQPSDTTIKPSEETLISQPSVEKLKQVEKKDAGTDPIAKVNASTQVSSDSFKFDKSTETTFNIEEEDSLSLITSYENSVLWKRTSIFPA